MERWQPFKPAWSRLSLMLPTGVRSSILRAAAAYLIGATLLAVDPFGFSATLDRVGRDAFYKVMAPTFPPDRVSAAAVIIDDDFLEARSTYWPLPYLAHGELVRTIASYRPDALFIDVVFVDRLPDPTLPGFIAALEAVAETTPVFLAAASPETGASAPIRPELQSLADRNERVTLVSILFGRGLGSDRAYRLTPDDAGRPSAAVALHLAQCGEDAAACAPIPPNVDLDLVWPLPHAFNCETPAEPCRGVARNPLIRFVRYSAGGILGGLAPRFLEEPYPIEAAGVPALSADAVARGANRERLRPLLEGRVIFYGANLALTGDTVRSPVNGEVPGVLGHATAFANLEVYGTRFVRAAAPFGMPASAHLGLLLALAVVTGYAVEYAAVRRGVPAARRLQLQIAAHLALAAAVTWIEFGFLRSGPANWWGVFSAVAAARWVVGRLRIG